MKDSFDAFKEKLEEEHKWPTDYLFKFVVPAPKESEFRELFSEESFEEKRSRAGNYISFSIKKMIYSSDEVIDMYLKARKIEGMIAL